MWSASSRRTRTGITNDQRNHPRGRHRLASASADARGVQAAAAGLRQADGLLPAHGADARRHSGRARDHDSGRPFVVRETTRQRQPVGHTHRLRNAERTERHRRGISDRRAISQRRALRPSPRRQLVSRRRSLAGLAGGGRVEVRGVRIRTAGARSGTIRRRGLRCRWARDLDRGKAADRRNRIGPSPASISTTSTWSRSPNP